MMFKPNRRRYHFVSFAKSGRTWVRLFLNHYYFNRFPLSVTSRDDRTYSDRIPEITYTHGNHYAADFRTIAKTIRKLRRQNVLLMIRDPRDVFVSYYFQRTKRNRLAVGKSRQIDWSTVTMAEMIRDPVFGIHRIIDFTNAWHAALPSFGRSFLIQYERLRNNPLAEFTRLVEFMDRDRPNVLTLERAIEETDFRRMQERERSGLHGDSELTAGSAGDAESFKVRRGKVGGYADYLADPEIEYANAAMENLRRELKLLFPVAAASDPPHTTGALRRSA